MTIIFTSPSAIAPQKHVDLDVVNVLTSCSDEIPVAVISNNPKPTWFDEVFQPKSVIFLQVHCRQDGATIANLSNKFSIPAHDFIVLGGCDEDIQMAKNGGAVFVPAGWIPNWEGTRYGLVVKDIEEFKKVVHLSFGWTGEWFFEGNEPWYTVRSLSNVSGINVSIAQSEWAGKIVNTVKSGGPRLQALLTVVARSLLMTGTARQDKLMWGYYPSSSSENDEAEVLSDLTHRLRTVVSRVRFAQFGEPLFIRHTHSIKRSRSSNINRLDPSEQLETLHLNPFYRKKISDRNVIVLDDCTTYGVSFGVAAALLLKAGAASVNCIALGKFGNQLRYYEIEINSDPFSPILNGQYEIKRNQHFTGSTRQAAQTSLIDLVV